MTSKNQKRKAINQESPIQPLKPESTTFNNNVDKYAGKDKPLPNSKRKERKKTTTSKKRGFKNNRQNTIKTLNKLKLTLKDESAFNSEKMFDMLIDCNKSIDFEVLLTFINALSQIFDEESTVKLEVLQLVFQKRFLDAILAFMQQQIKELIKTDEGVEKCNTFFRDFMRLSVLAISLLPASSLIFLKHTLIYTKTILCRLKGRIEITHQHFDFIEIVNQIEAKAKIEEIEREKVSSLDVKTMRSMSVLPTVQDLFDKPPELKKNIVEGTYENVDHYLTVQFTLLHEDFVAPVREGILQYLSQPSNNTRRKNQVLIYDRVRITHATIDSGKFGHVVQLGKNINWEIVTRFFIFGSLLLFTTDYFKSFFTGTVIDFDYRNKTVAVKLDKGYFKVCTDIYTKEFIMAVSKVFFEPYYQVLSALQTMSPEDFPMKKYIVEVRSEPEPPAYINQLGLHKYKLFETISTNILEANWPLLKEFNTFNSSQYKAFQAALTNEFVAIQGPPGTGKTFLGLQIVSTLLDNVQNGSPILVVCYKNHALDQFLEGISNKTKQIIRIGGRSQNENVKKFNIKKRRGNYGNMEHEFLKKLVTSYFRTKYQLDGLSKHGILALKSLIPYISPELKEELMTSNFEDWLMEGVFVNEESTCENLSEMDQDNCTKKPESNCDFDAFSELKTDEDKINIPSSNDKDKFYFSEESKQRYVEMYIDDYSEVYDGVDEEVQQEVMKTTNERLGEKEIPFMEPYFTLTIRTLKSVIEEYENEAYQLEHNEDLNEFEKNYWLSEWQAHVEDIANRISFLKRMLCMKSSYKSRDAQKICSIGVQSGIWALSNSQRWLLYHSWLDGLAEDMKRELIGLEESIRFGEQRLDEARSEEDLAILRNAKVVAVTTSGAAKNRSTLNKLGAKIVIIEEAAEVLESHIVTSLSSSCQHLVLIGDHKQLKPNPAVYKLCKKYNFDISLFERMIRNGMNCYTLDVQHRMRPEFASLIAPSIYPELENHPSTENREDIRGIHSNLYFVNHTNPEEQLLETQSHVNEFEAKFVLELANYLVLQGYLAEEITILATYSGQMKKIMKMKYHTKENMTDLRITTVDDFQGEENKIIILSLVRSNEEGEIGFLKIENRVCVALSRARDGLYIIGNMDCLAENSLIWPQVKERLIEHNAIGETLSVYCQNHKETVTLVKEAEMWEGMPEGGCARLCEVKLDCGHVCKYHCHPRDKRHEGQYMCSVPCERTCRLGHPCRKRCGEACVPCKYRVEFHLPCNHKLTEACSSDPATLTCKADVPWTLPCGHESTKKCGQTDEQAGRQRCKCVYGKPSQFGFGIFRCTELCHKICKVKVEKTLDCKHKVMVECCERLEPVTCQQVVEKTLNCGHLHSAPCSHYKKEISCLVETEKTLSCGHLHSDPCFKFQKKTTVCLTMVEKTLECSHTETVACGQPIEEVICTKETSRVLSCGHEISAQCGLPLNELECRKPCKRILKCGHICMKLCFKPCLCKTEVEKELECGHKVKTQCRYRSTLVCDQPCERDLACGHKVKTQCGFGSTLVCDQPCERDLPCGHKCEGKCSAKCDVNKCQTLVLSRIKPGCAHNPVMAPCRLNYIESEKLELELIQFCKAKCGVKLICGHNCKGVCGKCRTSGIHSPCEQPCPKVFPCSHRCPKKCSEECGVCSEKCLNRCSHRKCDRKCGEPCNVCKERCERGCVHQNCSRLCFAICDRKPCTLACPAPRSCGHPCPGFCGEPCPTLCPQCEPRHPLVTNMRGNLRLVILEDCGHNVDAANMDAFVNRYKSCIPVCPIVSCRTPVITTKRYHKEITQAFSNINKLKRQLLENTRNNAKSSVQTYQQSQNNLCNQSNRTGVPRRHNQMRQNVHDTGQPAKHIPFINETTSSGSACHRGQNGATSRGRPYPPGQHGATSRGRPYPPGQHGATSRGRPYPPGQHGATSRGRPYPPGQHGATSRGGPYPPGQHGATSRGRPYPPGQHGATSRGRPYSPGQHGATSRGGPYPPGQHGATSRGRPYPPGLHGATSRGRPYRSGQNGTIPRDPYYNPRPSGGRPYETRQQGASTNLRTENGRSHRPWGEIRAPFKGNGPTSVSDILPKPRPKSKSKTPKSQIIYMKKTAEE